LHGTGQAYGCFADISNTLNLKAAVAWRGFILAAVICRVSAVGSGERMMAFRL
jgi:hypothetical protein